MDKSDDDNRIRDGTSSSNSISNASNDNEPELQGWFIQSFWSILKQNMRISHPCNLGYCNGI